MEPAVMKNPIKQFRYWRWYFRGRVKIIQEISKFSAGPIRIVIGSGNTNFPGWVKTDLPHFNVLNESDWKYFFGKINIDHLLAEHVLEHLEVADVEKALRLAHQYLKINGTFRIAVPDGFNPDPEYMDHASPAGRVGSYHGHKSLWNYHTLSTLANANHFQIKLLEYFDEKGNHVCTNFSDANGFIERSAKNGKNQFSLIADLIKENK
jgi:predicted SAM-dependent methyltransferase